MSENTVSNVGWNCRLAAFVASKVARDNGITTRAQLNTFIQNGTTAADKALRRMATSGVTFEGETDADFASIIAGVIE